MKSCSSWVPRFPSDPTAMFREVLSRNIVGTTALDSPALNTSAVRKRSIQLQITDLEANFLGPSSAVKLESDEVFGRETYLARCPSSALPESIEKVWRSANSLNPHFPDILSQLVASLSVRLCALGLTAETRPLPLP